MVNAHTCHTESGKRLDLYAVEYRELALWFTQAQNKRSQYTRETRQAHRAGRLIYTPAHDPWLYAGKRNAVWGMPVEFGL